MKINKFEKETYNGVHIIPGTILDALYKLFFKSYNHSNIIKNMDYIVNYQLCFSHGSDTELNTLYILFKFFCVVGTDMETETQSD